MRKRTGMTVAALLAAVTLGCVAASGRPATAFAAGKDDSHRQELVLLPADQPSEKPLSPADQFQALFKKFGEAANAFYTNTQADAEGAKELATLEALLPQFLEL